MSRKSINFDDRKINKSNFYKSQKLFKIEDINVNKILVSKKESPGTKKLLKYFIGYNDDDVIRPLCIRLPQMIDYVKCFDNNKAISFKTNDNKLLKKYGKISGKISNLINMKFQSESVYGENDKHIKTKIKSHGDKINTNFQGKKITKENASYKCLSLIMLDSVIRANKKYYPQIIIIIIIIIIITVIVSIIIVIIIIVVIIIIIIIIIIINYY